MKNKRLQIDEQTLSDLTIFAKSNKPSVFSLFNKTATEGGSKLMEAIFKEPLASVEAINQRSSLYQFFSKENYIFPVDTDSISTTAFYMENDDVRTQIEPGGQSFSQLFKDAVASDPDYVFVHEGVQAVLRVFYQANEFVLKLRGRTDMLPYAEEYEALMSIIIDKAFLGIMQNENGSKQPKLSSVVLSDLDKVIRFKEREKILALLDLLYRLDVYMTVGQVARKREFYFGKALPPDTLVLNYEGVYHPHVENAIANDLSLNEGENMLFLTGANMAGKSTLMKSLGVALYLGHMGFPVSAKKFEFSVKDALYTSINLADNLQQGASLYYAEVLRVKEVARQLESGNKLFVIFDEMFRGTNVKDAYDATVAITRAFAKKQGSQFIISTHIVEAGEELMAENLGIKYQFLPTGMNGPVPVYPRILREGISVDRHGMIIIQNEKVLEILDEGLTH